ncbi:MAG: hypothetical protein BMS9Abin20_0923 [Acidimicrobiia bacterium]|nr:MAG: hypothetical protein BMS9Abin20_0923 [Acidimicrobiia bacterium]
MFPSVGDTEMTPTTGRSHGRVRMRFTAVLVILFGISLVAANHAGWLATTVLETDAFVSTLAPLPSDSAVSRALGESVADGIIESYEVRESITDTLPNGLAFIAAPLTRGLRDVIADSATDIIQSDAFKTIWTAVTRTTHRVAITFVRGIDSDVITTEDGVVVLDLTEVGAQVADRLDELGFDLLDGAEPDLTIELFEINDTGLVAGLARLIYSIRWFSFFLTAALLGAAYVVATNRRKLTAWVGSATILAMLVSIIDNRWLRSAVVGGIEDPVQNAGADAAWGIIFKQFFVQSWSILILGVVIATTAWLMGDSERARTVRRTFTGLARTHSDVDSEPSGIALFVASYRLLLQWAAVVVVSGFLILGPPPSFGVIVVCIAVVILFALVVEYIAASVQDDRTTVEPVT